ncbi:MAG TPA: ABC transporter ATP-binding protein [Polyangiaceae bacterium]|nr:ABC transporter ATP-binding protein [Polyangiaceae bacterium]
MTQRRMDDLEAGVVLEADNVSRHFGEIRALSGVSLRVTKGQLFGLVGPDGAGKTSLIRALSGLIDVDTGEIRVFGKNPLRDASLRDRMGVMPQHYSLYGDLSIAENLKFFADLYCLSRREYQNRCERLLELTRLAPFVERRADALSGGMYKKLALACALLHEPAVLLLDEPTNGVDPVSRRELWQLLYQFAADGMAILISTAYMDEVSRCHQVCLLHQGRVIADGTPQDLVRQMALPVFEVRGGEREELHAWFNGQPGIVAASPAGERLRIVLDPNVVENVEVGLRAFGASLQSVPADFEDVFLASIQHRDERPPSKERA